MESVQGDPTCRLSANALCQRHCRTRLLVRQSNEIHQTHTDAVRVDRACEREDGDGGRGVKGRRGER